MTETDDLHTLALRARAGDSDSEDRFHELAGVRLRTRRGFPSRDYEHIPRFSGQSPRDADPTFEVHPALAGSGQTIAAGAGVVSVAGEDEVHGVDLHSGAPFSFEFQPSHADGPGELLVPLGDEFCFVGLTDKRLQRRRTSTGELLEEGTLAEPLDEAAAAADRLVGATATGLVGLGLAPGELGGELWRVALEAPVYNWCVTPGRVFVVCGDGLLRAHSCEDGAGVWKRQCSSLFLAEADGRGVVALQGETTLTEHDAISGEVRWAYGGSDLRILGLGLGSEVAVVRRSYSESTPSADPFEFATATEKFELVGIDRESGELRFTIDAGRSDQHVCLIDGGLLVGRSAEGTYHLEVYDLADGSLRFARQISLPDPEPQWWRVSLLPGRAGVSLLGVDPRCSPYAVGDVPARLCLGALA